MSPEPTTSISLDYLIEFSDDAAQPEPPEAEVIVIPPPQSAEAAPNPVQLPDQKPQA